MAFWFLRADSSADAVKMQNLLQAWSTAFPCGILWHLQEVNGLLNSVVAEAVSMPSHAGPDFSATNAKDCSARVCVCVCLCLHADVSRFSCGSCCGYALGWHVCSDPSDALQMPHRTERTGQNIGMNSVTRTHAHRKSEWPKPNTEKR